jgi:hypothetical protein
MDRMFDVALKVAAEDRDAVVRILSESGVMFDPVEKKGLDGQTEVVLFIISGTVAVLRAAAKVIEEKYKAARSAEITIDGMTIKGVSERAVTEVLESVRAARDET